MNIADSIRMARENVGLTHAELAQKCKLRPSTVVSMESGKGTMQSLQAVAQQIDVLILGFPMGANFGEEVRGRRLDLNLSQRGLAAKAGISVPTVRSIESNTATLKSFETVIEKIAL